MNTFEGTIHVSDAHYIGRLRRHTREGGLSIGRWGQIPTNLSGGIRCGGGG